MKKISFIFLATVLALAVSIIPISADNTEAKLTASDAAVDDYFGCSVSQPVITQ